MIHLLPYRNFLDDKGYSEWKQSVKEGDRVLIQKFVPKSEYNPYEHWSYVAGEYRGDRVIESKTHEPRPIRSDFVLTYWNSVTAWGEVFAARLVPLLIDVFPRDGYRWEMDGPVYQPGWRDSDPFYRNFLKVEFGGRDEIRRNAQVRNAIGDSPYHYLRYDCCIYVVFATVDRIKEIVEAADGAAEYLYNEPLR